MKVVPSALVRDVLTPELALRAVLPALLAQHSGDTALSAPRAQFLQVDEHTRFQSKGAVLRTQGVAGFRLAGERDHRYVDEGRYLILFDTETLLPIAAVAEEHIYRARVGAQIALAVRHLRAPDAGHLALIGAGKLAESVLSAARAVEGLERFTVASRSGDSARHLVARMSTAHPGTAWSAADSVAEATAQAQVIVTLTNAQAPILGPDVLRDGVLVVSAGGGIECPPQLYRTVDRLVVDDLDQCRQFGDLAPLLADGSLDDSAVSATLAEVVSGARPGRTAASERIAAVTQGMAILDVAVALAVVQAAG